MNLTNKNVKGQGRKTFTFVGDNLENFYYLENGIKWPSSNIIVGVGSIYTTLKIAK